MARTRQKKRVVTGQPKEMDLVAEDEAGENQQPNQTPLTPKLDPTPLKKVKKSTTTKVERTTRAAAKRIASRNKTLKGDSGPTPPPPSPLAQKPRPASTLPALMVTEDLTYSDSEEIYPVISITRLPALIVENGGKKAVSIITPTRFSPAKEKTPISPKSSQQSDGSDESPQDSSTEQVRNYVSPNDALSSTTLYATLGCVSPQINNSKGELDELNQSTQSTQSTQRASSTYFNKNVHEKSMVHSCNLSIESETAFGITYYFIETAAGDENQEIMEKAYFCMVSRGFSATWIAEADVANLPDDNEFVDFYFVLPVFDGPLFETLRDHPKWKVYSPIGLLRFHSQPTPVRDYPVMDFSMRNCFVTVSGLPREVRKNLEDKMRLMSCQISSSIKDRTTHVVASSWNTEKCMFARTNGHPLVMSPDWVEFCWESIQENADPIDAADISYERTFRLPIFAGFVISGANLSRGGQETLCDLVTEHGGVYQNVIDPFRTTHLVMVKREGPKYEKALENERIKIVQPDWVHESIARGYPLPEQDVTMKKMANKMFGKFMDFIGMVSTIFTDSFNRNDRSSSSLGNDVRVPGSPELSEDEIDNENVTDEEPNE